MVRGYDLSQLYGDPISYENLTKKIMYLTIGIIGSAFCIIALALTLRDGKFGESNSYKILNFCGGLCLLYYAIITNSLPFIILESIWVILPLISLLRKLWLAKSFAGKTTK